MVDSPVAAIVPIATVRDCLLEVRALAGGLLAPDVLADLDDAVGTPRRRALQRRGAR
jgi:hypothetical protein